MNSLVVAVCVCDGGCPAAGVLPLAVAAAAVLAQRSPRKYQKLIISHDDLNH